MKYRVTKQYARGAETAFAEFEDLNDAKLFIQAKLKEDAALKIKIIYRITQFDEILAEFDSSQAAAYTAESSTDAQSSHGSTSSFRPTPFNTTPTPPGLPKKWIRDEDEQDDKDGKK